VTEPGATVLVDGVRFGKTGDNGSLTIKTISQGAHTVRVRLDGYKEQRLTLTAAQSGNIKVKLIKTADRAELAFQEAEKLSFTDREKATESYNWAIKLRPNYPEAYVGLARVLTETGELENALKAIASARRLRPGYAEASAVEGRIYAEYGQEDKAVTAFKRAITEGKGFQPEALTGLGLLYKGKAEGFGGSGELDQEAVNYEESAKNLKAALKQLSGSPDAMILYQLLGLIYERQGQTAEAIELYEEFLEIFPESVEATAVRSFIVQLKKQTDDPQ
jgi:tetratricopeptide (TPR) repeat protein